MKKGKYFILSIVACLIICFGGLFVGCAPSDPYTGMNYKVGNIVFEKIEKSNYFHLFVEKNTKILYIYTKKGGFCVLYDKEGKPMTYDEYLDLQKK